MSQIYDVAGVAKGGRVFQIYDEPESPAEEACLGYMMTEEPASPNEGACLRYMMNRRQQMTGRV